MKDTTNNAIIKLAENAGVLEPENKNDQGYRYFTLDNSTYAVYPGRKNDYLLHVQQYQNVEVNAHQRETIVNGLEKKLALSSSNSSSLSTTPEKSLTSNTTLNTSSGSDEEIDSEVLELLKNRSQLGKEINGSRQKQEVLEKEIKEHDKSIQQSEKSIQQSEKSIQQSEKSIQQVTEWGKKELKRLEKENDKSNKKWEEYNDKYHKKSSGCAIL